MHRVNGLVLTGAAAGVWAGAGTGLGGWGMVLEAAWEERLSLTEGGEGNRGITGGTEGFFLLEGGTRGGGRDMGTGSPSRALYTRYMAWERATKINDNRQLPVNYPVIIQPCTFVSSIGSNQGIIFITCNSYQDCTYNTRSHINRHKPKIGCRNLEIYSWSKNNQIVTTGGNTF